MCAFSAISPCQRARVLGCHSARVPNGTRVRHLHTWRSHARSSLPPSHTAPLHLGTWHPRTLAPWHLGTWHPRTLAPWHLATWHPRTLAPWHLATWHPRTLAPWHFGTID